MITKESLLEDIRSFGIKESDTLTFHTSLKKVGKIETKGDETGADVLLSALVESVKNGLLVAPAHSWKDFRNRALYDVRNTESCLGAMPNTAIKWANAALDMGDKTCVRSMNPSHSVVCFGKRAWEYAQKDRKPVPTPTYRNGCYGSLYEENAKILFIGVDFCANTFIHVAEETFDPEGTTKDPFELTFIDENNNSYKGIGRVTNHPSSGFGIYQQVMDAKGLLKYGKIGEADAILCNARECYEVVWEMLENGTNK